MPQLLAQPRKGPELTGGLTWLAGLKSISDEQPGALNTSEAAFIEMNHRKP